MGCYYTLCHNPYTYSFLFYKVYTKRENAGSWNSGLEKEQILETYSRKLFPEYIKNTERKNLTRGATPFPRGWGARPTPWARPLPRGPPGGPPAAIFCYMKSFNGKKNKRPSSRMKLRRHEAEPWRNQSRALAELFYRGNFPPGGGNHRHRHHQRSSHRERAISINIFISTISSQNPSSSLVSNSCLQVRDWC